MKPANIIASCALAALAPAAAFAGDYTNHAGVVVSGTPILLEDNKVAISNSVESLQIQLSAFPDLERRRIKADAGDPEMPQAIRAMLNRGKGIIGRAKSRQEGGQITEEQAKAHIDQTMLIMRSSVKGALDKGELTEQEYRLVLEQVEGILSAPE